MNKRPLITLLILVASAAMLVTGCGSTSNTVSAPATTSTSETAADATAADASTGGTTSEIGQGVDETCNDLVGFFTLVESVDMARGGHSVSDVEEAAAAASELASKAPAEPDTSFLSGEPRESLETIANAYGTYATLLSDEGLEAGPDALLDSRVADVMDDVTIDVSMGLLPWIDARCDAEAKARMEAVGS